MTTLAEDKRGTYSGMFHEIKKSDLPGRDVMMLVMPGEDGEQVENGG